MNSLSLTSFLWAVKNCTNFLTNFLINSISYYIPKMSGKLEFKDGKKQLIKADQKYGKNNQVIDAKNLNI